MQSREGPWAEAACHFEAFNIGGCQFMDEKQWVVVSKYLSKLSVLPREAQIVASACEFCGNTGNSKKRPDCFQNLPSLAVRRSGVEPCNILKRGPKAGVPKSLELWPCRMATQNTWMCRITGQDTKEI